MTSPAIAAIYSHHVLTGTATFEEIPPDTDEMATRLSGLVKAGFPVLVACTGQLMRLWAMPMPARIRPGLLTGSRLKIRFIFIANICAKGPAGRCCLLLLITVRPAITNRFWRSLVIQIIRGQLACTVLVDLCLSGTARDLGFKFGRWLDVVYMQLSLQADQSDDEKGPYREADTLLVGPDADDAGTGGDHDAGLPVTEVDLLVVGGGFTGLSAALTAARLGKSVLVCDAGQMGLGASTRNGGICSGNIRHDHGYLEKHYGRGFC